MALWEVKHGVLSSCRKGLFSLSLFCDFAFGGGVPMSRNLEDGVLLIIAIFVFLCKSRYLQVWCHAQSQSRIRFAVQFYFPRQGFSLFLSPSLLFLIRLMCVRVQARSPPLTFISEHHLW